MKYTFTLFFLCFSGFLFGQNLVSNPSFEAANYRPQAMLDEGKEFTRHVGSWVSPNYASPDFITNRFRSSKINTIPAHSGENMIGIVVQGPHWGEYASIKLKEPLEVGQKYYVEYWLSAPAYYAKKNTGTPLLNEYFGARFDKRIWITDTKVIKRKPQIAAQKGVRLQPEKWIKINGSYIAEEASTHLIIGQFMGNDFENVIKGYFFVDDIFVEKIEKEAERFEPSKTYRIKGKVASIVLENIYFETDKYELLPESFTELNKLVNIMHQNSSMTTEIHGHTDDQGGEMHNQALSENRAKAVFDYLSKQGVASNRMSIKGFGISKPIDSNKTDQGRKRNRRVEFVTNATDTIGEGFVPSDVAYLFSDQVKDSPYRLSTIGKSEQFWNCNTIVEEPYEDAFLKESKSFSKYQTRSAAPFILEKTKDKKIVCLQIEPEYSSQLVFVFELLEDLYAQGFRQIGFQNINNLESLSKNPYPTLDLGQPFQHPLYGSVIRRAQELGFTFFTYSPSNEQIGKAKKILKKDNFRKSEVEQKRAAMRWASAMNINRVVQKNQSDKILLLHSFFQKENKENVKTMLQWLQQFSRSTPYVVHQTNANSICATQNGLTSRMKNTQPSIFVKGEKILRNGFSKENDNKEIGYFADIQVFYPKEKMVNKRPEHLLMKGERKAFPLNIDKFKMNYPCLIYAYKNGEDINHAIPFDIIEHADNQDDTKIILPKGNYTIVLRDTTKRKKMEVTIE